MRDVAARKSLREWLQKSGTSQQQLADSLQVSQPSVSAWIYGPSRPDTHRREALEAITGIPADAWKTAREAALIARARSAAA